MINILVVYKITNTQTLTYTSIQSFTKFVNVQKIEAGVVQGPCSHKFHLVTIINNTQHNVGFITSKHKLSQDAQFISPKSYLNSNILIDRTKMKFFPINSNIVQRFIFLTTINAVRPLIRNFDSFKVVRFETNNFSNINPRTQD